MKAFRKVIFWMHLICGTGAGIVVFIMSITGVALTYEKQMLDWADGFRVEAPAGNAGRMGPEALLVHATTVLGRTPSGLQLHADPSEPARLQFGRESVAVNPYTGAEMGEGATGLREFFRQMILWHRWLGQEGEGRAAAKAITGGCNLAFLFIVISGAYLWWPKQWTRQHLRPVVWFRGGLAGKARDFNWHNVLGLWSVVPLVLLVATAVFFSYSWAGDMLYTITGEEQPAGGGRGGPPRGAERGRPERGREPSRERPGGLRPGGPVEEQEAPSPELLYAGLDELFANAGSTKPGWRTITLNVPRERAKHLSFSIDRGYSGTRPDLRSTIVMDRATGKVVRREGFADQPVARQARSWIRFIHTGEAGGWIGQTIAGIASGAACVLVYTGWALTWRRFWAWRRRASS